MEYKAKIYDNVKNLNAFFNVMCIDADNINNDKRCHSLILSFIDTFNSVLLRNTDIFKFPKKYANNPSANIAKEGDYYVIDINYGVKCGYPSQICKMQEIINDTIKLLHKVLVTNGNFDGIRINLKPKLDDITDKKINITLIRNAKPVKKICKKQPNVDAGTPYNISYDDKQIASSSDERNNTESDSD